VASSDSLAIRAPKLCGRISINLNETTLAANVTRRLTASLNWLNEPAELLAANLQLNGIRPSCVKLNTGGDISGTAFRTFLVVLHNSGGCKQLPTDYTDVKEIASNANGAPGNVLRGRRAYADRAI
jgi:hypothetical protein